MLDIDGYSWCNESLLKFFNNLLKETDDYSNQIKKLIFTKYWDYVTCDGLMEIRYCKRPDWLELENMPSRLKAVPMFLTLKNILSSCSTKVVIST